MALLYGHTGRVIYTDGVDAPARLSNEGALMVAEQRGKYYDAVMRGNMFISTDQAAAAAGTAIPIFTSVTPVGDVLWNPAGSGFNMVLVSYHIEQVSGNPVVTPIFLMRVSGAGSEIATGAVFSAFAKTTPVNCLVGKGNSSKTFSSNVGTCTLTTAGAIAGVFYNMFGLPAITANAIAFNQLHHEFDGKVILPPGTVCYAAGTVASVALYQKTWVWEEVPV